MEFVHIADLHLDAQFKMLSDKNGIGERYKNPRPPGVLPDTGPTLPAGAGGCPRPRPPRATGRGCSRLHTRYGTAAPPRAEASEMLDAYSLRILQKMGVVGIGCIELNTPDQVAPERCSATGTVPVDAYVRSAGVTAT